MLDLDSFLVSLYVHIDDWWKANHPSPTPRRGRPALLGASEVLTLAILAQWPRWRSERDFFGASPLRTCARLLPEPVLPGPAQPEGARPGARVARVGARLRRGALRALGRLPRLGHDPDPGGGEGKGLPQGAFHRPSELRAQRVEDRVGLRLQGGAGGRPRGRDHRLRPGFGGFGREAHRRGPRSLRPAPRLPAGRQGLHGGIEWERLCAEVYGALVSRPPRRTTRAGRGRKRIAAGRRASARSSKG